MKVYAFKKALVLVATGALCFFPAGTWAKSRSQDEKKNIGHKDDETDSLVCGCRECTAAVLDSMAGDHTCGERIYHLLGMGIDEEEACIRVGRTEFRDICGGCDPGRCDGKKLPSEEISTAFCGCKDCRQHVWDRPTAKDGQYSCGARITYLTDFEGFSMTDACTLVGGTQFSGKDSCGLCDPATCEPVHGSRVGEKKCGCSRCVDSVWNLDAEGYTCGERIEFLLQDDPKKYPTEADACRQVAGVEFPGICGTNCNPDTCDAPLTARTDLYCFPPFQNRTRYRTVWGKYTVEGKQAPLVERDDLLGVLKRY
jgi:hypothetical protein